MMARPVKPRKHPKEETTHGAGKEFKAEHHKRSKKLQDADGIANRENGEQAKEAVGNIEEKIFSKKEIHEMIASQQRLREELESKQLETSALRKLVDALVEGAVPLAVPVEVFYKIGQQYLEKNAHAFSLQFPPLEELLSKADNVGDSSDTEALDFRGGEGEAGGEANGEGADNEGSLEGFEVFDELEEAAEPAEDSRGQKAKLLEEKRKEEMFTKSIAERKAKSLLALEAWQREEGLAATFSGLLEELKLKSEMSETLLQQNEIMRKQNQILTQQVSRWEKEFHVVDEKYQELQDKVNCITKQAEAILRNNKEIPPTETISIMPELKGEALDMQWRGRPTPSKTPGAPTASGTLAVNNKVIPVIVAPPVCHKFQSTMQQKRGDFLPSAEPDKPREERVLRASKVVGVKNLFPPCTKTQVVSCCPQTRRIDTAAPCYLSPFEQAGLTHTFAFLNNQAQTLPGKGAPPNPPSFRPIRSPSQAGAGRR